MFSRLEGAQGRLPRMVKWKLVLLRNFPSQYGFEDLYVTYVTLCLIYNN